MKRVWLNAAADRRLALGIRRSVSAIAPSLGPHGRAVLMHRPPAAPVLLTDGYTIAREAADETGGRSIGARLLKETLFEVDRDLGDGTATAALVLDAVLAGGQTLIRAGYPSSELADALLELGNGLARQADAFRLDLSPEAAAAAVVRTAGAGGELAETILRVFLQLDGRGLLEAEEGHGMATEIRLRQGITVDAVLVSRLLSDAADRIFLRLEQPYILVADEEIGDFDTLLPVLEGFADRGKALVIVARDVTGAALHALVRNKLEAGLKVAALRVSDVVERGFDALEDLAIAVGAQLVSPRLGTSVSTLRPHMLGKAEAVEIDRDGARIVGARGNQERIQSRCAELRRRIERERYLSYDREHLERRHARLTAGFAKIVIGAPTRAEQQIRLTTARKAIAALKAARSGVVPGGGLTLCGLASLSRGATNTDSVLSAAGRIASNALLRIPRTIWANAGREPEARISRFLQVASQSSDGEGLIEHLSEVGTGDAVDPASVLLGAVHKGISTAATLLRADAVVA